MVTPPKPGMLSSREFQATIDAMHAHRRARAEAIAAGHDAPPEYELPDHLARAQLYQIPPPVQDLFWTYAQQPTSNQIEDNYPCVESAAEKRVSGQISQADFANILKQQISDNNSSVSDLNDDLEARSKALGQESADYMAAILPLLSKFSGYTTSMWHNLNAYLSGLESEQDANALLGSSAILYDYQIKFNNWFTQLMESQS
ncbi:hypothetical protein [Nocardia sp. NPDC049526]|uniref:hypothetical protein n=1 Tax=Nocardia sp. NPDC049526 TaxID=3364316 RepID=UPI00379E34A7